MKEHHNLNKMQAVLLLATSAVILCQQLNVVENVITDETRLHKDLFSDNRQVLPVNDTKERRVKVEIGLTLNQVVDVVSVTFV